MDLGSTSIAEEPSLISFRVVSINRVAFLSAGRPLELKAATTTVWSLDMHTLRLSVSKQLRRTELRSKSFDFGVNIGKNRIAIEVDSNMFCEIVGASLFKMSSVGTSYFYETFLRPYISKHETEIDRKLQELRARAWDLAIYYWQNGTKIGQSIFIQALRTWLLSLERLQQQNQR
ncbi:hypothetical protein TEA_027164 [Camellia sinensis var. sinensis]|uniref:Uncharacterized protein n=1 Tax=Camellia sinensis var. sinensis TaxID=542762 RepID=A0A4S4E7N7_CAMSN|nr:hypothetical protein TEA_027164 [Camellia sinensis var. sinensis]